ncbi:MAG: hypothetical protein BAA02_06545 [Paenibacillaceae bacterium ZCTH02-B3]|mgnify:CR=1 FL=1|nr:MAG: hypothetical protein BAA02_06545 [Paenibacillaceae bacterium ZCTH02-B3]
MQDWHENGSLVILLAVAFVALAAAFIWIGWLTARLNALKAAHRKLVGETGVPNLEDVLSAVHRELAELKKNGEELGNRVAQAEKRLSEMNGRVGIHRFNAFEGAGSDLSFSLAIVNDSASGAVLTAIHGRDQTFLYAKPVEKGESSYPLTPEEKTAIRLATQRE